MGRLDDLDLSQKLDREEYEERLAAAQKRLKKLRLRLAGLYGDSELGPGVLVVVEGSDAGGKGGAIKRMVEPLDVKHYSIHAFAKPTFEEKSRHFLWRFWKLIPGLGDFVVFDRSYYGRVLVERVEGYCTKTQWKRAYPEIVSFEKSLALEGIIVAKFWLQVSDAEQLKRFESRKTDPLKQWKLTDEDWRNRDKIDLYNKAVEDMFAKTDHPAGRWHLISGENKRYARVTMIETLCDIIEQGIADFESPIGIDDGWA